MRALGLEAAVVSDLPSVANLVLVDTLNVKLTALLRDISQLNLVDWRAQVSECGLGGLGWDLSAIDGDIVREVSEVWRNTIADLEGLAGVVGVLAVVGSSPMESEVVRTMAEFLGFGLDTHDINVVIASITSRQLWWVRNDTAFQHGAICWRVDESWRLGVFNLNDLTVNGGQVALIDGCPCANNLVLVGTCSIDTLFLELHVSLAAVVHSSQNARSWDLTAFDLEILGQWERLVGEGWGEETPSQRRSQSECEHLGCRKHRWRPKYG